MGYYYWLWGFRVKIANIYNSIVSQFPEETWAQRKPNQIYKNDQKASKSFQFNISNTGYSPLERYPSTLGSQKLHVISALIKNYING